MTPTGRIGPVKAKPFLLLPVLLVALGLNTALAHATLVFGELTTGTPNPDPVPGFTLNLHMMDPVRTPIEDATVGAEFRLLTEQELAMRLAEAPEQPPTAQEVESGEVEVKIPEGDWTRFAMQETGPGGNYAAQVRLPAPGTYQVIMRDTTYPQEDAVAELLLTFDGATAFEPSLFIFPPTDIGGASLGTWLVWLVAVPLVAGIIVTVVVLGGKPAGSKDDPAT